MSSLTDSEDEADQRPGFGHSSGVSDKGAGFVPRKAVRKRPYSEITESGDAGKNGSLRPADARLDDFIKKKQDSGPEMSEAARKMMARMGHKQGEGLGKHGQGRTQIVEASTQRGRRGLGMVVSGLEPSDVEWDFIKEEIVEDEVVEWLPKYSGDIPSLQEMLSWKEIGPKKREIDEETNFCSEETLKMMLSGKSVFDRLEPEEMRRARTRSNPYETIRGVIFLNRAAMKMANMDAILDFMFSNPRKPNGESLVEANELLYFADVCAGPGGFSEYLLWRKKGESKGFGLTLKGSNDFKLEDFYAGPPEMFEPHYGVGGLHGDGDIFNPDNQAAFRKFVLDNTGGQGVHVVMADGGFSVEGQENIQEILSKQLYLCQFLVAVSILRTGGHFVCKLFDLFTPFSVGLVYLMNMIFEQVAIFKPVTSRPANSERYIVCKNLKEDNETVRCYMHEINVDLCRYMSAVSVDDINHIVPLDTLMNDEPFFMYMVNSNENFAKVQAIHLKKIEVFTKNSQLYETRQSEVRKNCLLKWKIPDEVRAAPGRPDPNSVFQSMVKGDSAVLEQGGTVLTQDNLNSIKSLASYSCSVLGDGPTFHILGCGRFHVFRWDNRGKMRWQKLNSTKLELPSKTLLEVQEVQELKGEGKGQRRQTTIHVLDALFLCGEDVRQMSFEKRQEKLGKFVRALRKPTRSDLAYMLKPDVFPLEQIDKVFQRLSMRQIKGSNNPRLCYCNDSGSFFQPAGVSILQTVKEPWIRGYSKSTGRKYWFNILSRESVYECPSGATASVSDCKKNLLTWLWTDGVRVHPDQQHEDPKQLSKDQILAFIKKLRNP
ncbi:cap-specific mRNA (nucleoside-2'-O-)-methyltransferase 1 [Aplysia californica]|uniref:Cap-specific mRNA (nucleoside-2'-O-)-methyltransferase 1 n=1 Tax=Aplysia californica TaxID=6500 RepID=A0ABM0K354_APLCA|nr:cap-specific mRNA (nucleoside-2'-O-)-methyltransferase 1 [Aplysia californica]